MKSIICIGFLILFCCMENSQLNAQTYDVQLYTLLKKDPKAFKEMMRTQPERRVNLRGADLRGLDLSGIQLSGANLSYTRLEGVSLKEANLRNVNFIGAKMMNCNLDRSKLEGAVFDRANLTGASFKAADYEKANSFNMLIQIDNALYPATIVNGAVAPLSK